MTQRRIVPQLRMLVGSLGWIAALSAVAVNAAAPPAAKLSARDSAGLDAKRKATALEAFGNMPLAFEQNVGQASAGARFLSRGSGYALWLGSNEATLSLSGRSGQSSTLRMSLLGADPAAKVSGLDELAGKSNYLLGRSPSSWHTNIANYGKVLARSVYPGVDVVYYGRRGELEYDFLVSPSADPGRIQMELRGLDGASAERSGDLVLRTAAGTLRERCPALYQTVNGKQVPVRGGFRIVSTSGPAGNRVVRVAFHTGAYDHSRQLVIDPKLTYSTYVGGIKDDIALAVAVDEYGNAYLTGCTESPKIPFEGAIKPNIQGMDAFVIKINAAGCGFYWATYLGGSGNDCGNSIAIDFDQNVYVTGITNSLDFPVTAGVFQPAYGGGISDGFVCKLNADGQSFAYSSYLGGSLQDDGRGITVDPFGDAFVTGGTGSLDFPVTPGSFQTTFGGGMWDAYAVEVAPDASSLIWASYLGGGPTIKSEGDDWGNGIALDKHGDAYVTGATNAFNFPKLFPIQAEIKETDAFVTEFNPTGTGLLFSTYMGGNQYDEGFGIALDSVGYIYIVGTTASTSFPSAGPPARPYAGGDTDAFVVAMNPKATAVTYFTYFGTKNADTGRGIAVDTHRDIWITGLVNGPNAIVPLNGGPPPSIPHAYALHINPALSTKVKKSTGYPDQFIQYVPLAGSAADGGQGIAVDPYNNAYCVGFTYSTNFPTGIIPPFQPHNGGGEDGFAVKIPHRPNGMTRVAPQKLTLNTGVGIPLTRDVRVTNTGKGPLGCTIIPPMAPFSVGLASLQTVIPVSHTLTVPVTFNPSAAGRNTGTMQVITTAPGKHACITVHLVGNGH